MKTAVLVLLSGVVGLFGVSSAVLGFIAEAKKLTRDQIHASGSDCIYPANAAHTLGVCAILLLAVAQIIASGAGRCCGCCCRPAGGASSSSTGRRAVGIFTSVLSWVAAGIAVFLYLVGALLNAPTRRKATFKDSSEECYYPKGGIFVTAAVLSLVATAFGVISSVLLRPPAAATDDAPVQGQHGIGLPQWPVGYYGQEANPYAAQAQGIGQEPNPKLAPPPPPSEGHGQVYV